MKVFTFAALLLFSAPIFAQSIEFAPPGATWIYTHEVWDTWQGPSSVTVEKLRYTGNTTVDSISVKVLEMEGRKFHIYQDVNRVYFKREMDTAFVLLWDFGIMPGDYFESGADPLSPFSLVEFECTAVDSEIINGIELRRFHFNVLCGGGYWQQIVSNSRFGVCSDYLVLHLLIDCMFDFPHVYHFCSYSDDALSFYEPTSTGGTCTLVSTVETAAESLLLSPNPVTTDLMVSIPSDITDAQTIRVMDLWGRTLFEQQVAAQQTVISVGDLPNGMYQISLIREKGKSVEKLIMVGR